MSRDFVKILSFFAVLSMFFALGICSCDEKADQRSQHADNKQIKDSIENINRKLVFQEKEAIKEYVEKSGKSFVETGTGLRYCIENEGDGELIKTGNLVALDYKLSLLNGDLLDSSEKGEKKVFIVGHGGVESGLEEAVLMLHKGDEAEIIIPSHLAYGLTGDGDKIPHMATLVYKVKVIENQINY